MPESLQGCLSQRRRSEGGGRQGGVRPSLLGMGRGACGRPAEGRAGPGWVAAQWRLCKTGLRK